jgi:hypothetical protein
MKDILSHCNQPKWIILFCELSSAWYIWLCLSIICVYIYVHKYIHQLSPYMCCLTEEHLHWPIEIM